MLDAGKSIGLVNDLPFGSFNISPQITQIDEDDISKVLVFICVICVICGQNWVGGWDYSFGNDLERMM